MDEINSAQIHDMLFRRKLKKDETLQEYYYAMKEIAARGKIEAEALMKYVIDGIQDDTQSKIILYGAKKLTDFKEKLKVYETIRKKNAEKTKVKEKDNVSRKTEGAKKSTTANSGEKEQGVEVRCYNCGGKGYKSKDCKKKELGKKCFKCQKYGHTANLCNALDDSKAVTDKKTAVINTVTDSSNGRMFKQITINDVQAKALINTGSQITVMRKDVYDKMKSNKLCENSICLTGFGKNEVNSFGCVNAIIEVDSEEYSCIVHVVPNEATNSSVIIGSDFLAMTEITVNNDGITIRRATVQLLTQINMIETQSLNIGNMTDSKVREEVETIVKAYQANKCKTTDVNMRIVPKDERPIFQKPRRLPAPEREIVENQIDEWLNDGVIEKCTSES
ncbi:hypothetical protein ALC62_03866 [Cyphomyrmex costatus]|uniref:CCHC-type domain-containing protein n=1 Tax=Cyphomyrmex costatus TaxID=456900 RepID=A0A151IKW6_9HYME|nr:hypothetical protein ALC62_03866 [Cyphomyrmex costatus]